MAALLSNIVASSPLESEKLQSSRRPPSQSSTASPPPTQPHKTFRMFRTSLGETLRTATRSKAKHKDHGLDGSANVLTLKEAVQLPAPGPSRSKDKDKVQKQTLKVKVRAEDEDKTVVVPVEPTTDASATASPDDPASPKGLRRFSSKTTFGKRKSTTPSSSSPVESPARPPKSNGWPTFMKPSISQASISSPALHLSSDPTSKDTPTTQMSPATSIGALISPPRTKRTSSSTPIKKYPPTAGSSSRPFPSPPVLTLSSSPSTFNKGHPRFGASHSTSMLPDVTGVNRGPSTPPRGIIRRSIDSERGRYTSQEHSRERSSSRSPSPSGSQRQRTSPIAIPASPTPMARRTSARSSLDSHPKAITFTSSSASHLPLSGNHPATPTHIRRSSRERNIASTPPPSASATSHLIYQQRRNSSSASIRASSPSASTTRAISPGYQKRAGSASTTSLVLSTPLSPQREALRQAASFIVKQMTRPPPLSMRNANQDVLGGLAGVSSRIPVNPWEEVEGRLRSLSRMERIWRKSGVSAGTISVALTRDTTSGSTGSEGGSGSGSGFMASAPSAGGGGEEKERKAFLEALRDGYVLCQLLNKLDGSASLVVPRVDPREDGIGKTSNVVKFREATRMFIVSRTGVPTEDLGIFKKDDLMEGTPDSISRVVDTILLIATTWEAKSPTPTWSMVGKEKDRESTKRTSRESERERGVDVFGGRSQSPPTVRSPYGSITSHPAAASSPNLTLRSSHSPAKSSRRYSPPSPAPLATLESGRSISQAAIELSPGRPSMDIDLDSDGPSGSRTKPSTVSSSTPTPATPPALPPALPPRRMRGDSNNSINRMSSSPQPGPPPPRSSRRNPPPSLPPSNRVSTATASSRQSHGTEHTLFDNRTSNRFGTVRTMNTVNTEATSIHMGEGSDSWGRDDSSAIFFDDGFEPAMLSPPLSPRARRRSHELKNHPPTSSFDALQDIAAGRTGRRDRKSSEVAADLTRVQEESTDIEGSIIRKPSTKSRASEGKEPRPKLLDDALASSPPPSVLKLGQGKWPDDFIHLLNPSLSPTKLQPATPPPLPRRSNSTRTSNETRAKPNVPALATRPPIDAEKTPQADKTPKGKLSLLRQANGSTSADNTPSLSRDQQFQRLSLGDLGEPFSASPVDLAFVSPSSPNGSDSFLKSGQHFRRPLHRRGSQSVDVLLSQERRPSQLRLQSSERLQNSSEGSSGNGSSGSSQERPAPSPSPLVAIAASRPMARRSSSRSTNTARHGMYIANPPSLLGEVGLSSPMAAAVSVPSLPSRVPFPRASSGEYSFPPVQESHMANSNLSSDALLGGSPPLPFPSSRAAANGVTLLPSPGTPPRPSLIRPRYQSDLELRNSRRRSSTQSARQLNTVHQRSDSEGGGTASGDEQPRATDMNPTPMPRRSRFESTPTSASNLTRGSSDMSGMQGSAVRQTLTVKEQGKTPMHYQLGNCIGRGQFGSVYRALNLNSGQMVAVKRIRLDGRSENEVTQLMKEVDLLKKLTHPSIVKYEGMARDEDALSIVLEYVENGSLGQTLKAFGKLNESLVATYVTKILEGLHYLHEQEVVHCDLKAANILTTKNGNIKLSDFGVSLSLRAMENIEEENVQGTPNWMAPEVISLQGASTASDIWSLGCTIVELLTGRPPYVEIGNPMAVMFRIVESDEPPIPEGLSDTLRDFLEQCFKKDPLQRPSAEMLFEHPWLKRRWGEHKELRPQDSIPFLRRVSTDLHKSDIARQLSIMEFNETPNGRRESDAAAPSFVTPTLTAPDPEFLTRPHSFVKTTFSKPVVCRVCHQYVKKSAVLCDECSLICHSKCSMDAPPTCDVRAQLLAYAQYAQGSRDSPALPSNTPLPSPLLHGPSSPIADGPLSSSPSFPRIFPWRRNSRTTLAGEAGPSSLHLPPEDAASPQPRRAAGGLLFARGRMSEDRSRSRGSLHGGSQHSSSSRSGRTIGSRTSYAGGTVTTYADPGREDGDESARSSAIRPESTASQPAPVQIPNPSISSPSDATRRRRRRDSQSTSRSDCVIQ